MTDINVHSSTNFPSLSCAADSLGPMCLFSDDEGLGQVIAKKEVKMRHPC